MKSGDLDVSFCWVMVDERVWCGPDRRAFVLADLVSPLSNSCFTGLNLEFSSFYRIEIILLSVP